MTEMRKVENTDDDICRRVKEREKNSIFLDSYKFLRAIPFFKIGLDGFEILWKGVVVTGIYW